MVNLTSIKQQWLVIQQTKRKYHPYKAAIQDIIIAMNKKFKESHEIILSIDGNELSINVVGKILKLCRDCKIFDPFDHKHGNTSNAKLHLRGFQKKRLHLLLVQYTNYCKSVT